MASTTTPPSSPAPAATAVRSAAFTTVEDAVGEGAHGVGEDEAGEEADEEAGEAGEDGGGQAALPPPPPSS
ncbi:hypothetical protein ACFXAF_29575 [Kitasatospora sp. NPDC059463]|uniref:hypothetical protein n=1 Tax=unclassified Kitasatospora TaxID=2633591 RepID=UPI00369C2F2F